MKTIFRTYNKFNASIFDLIGGKNEVKQTIALGYLLSKDKSVLNDFLRLKPILSLLGKLKLEDYNKVIIHSELVSKTGKRADIVIQMYKNDIPSKAILIEAKSIGLNTSSRRVVKQIEDYVFQSDFPSLIGFDLYGCLLTKNNLVFKPSKVVSISWNEIIKILLNKEGLAKDYLEFLTKITGSMKFYEKEVLSIPTGGTYILQSSYPHIYGCPNEGKNFKSLKKPLYVTFRKGKGGEMERLYGVDEIIILNPKKDFEAFLNNSQFSDSIKNRIKTYCDKMWVDGNYIDNEKQFFILSITNTIELKHKPKPPKNNTFRAYYKLSDLLNTSNNVIEK